MAIRGRRNERKRNEKNTKTKTKINKNPLTLKTKINKHKNEKKETSIYTYVEPQTNQHSKITKKGEKNHNERIISAEVVKTVGKDDVYCLHQTAHLSISSWAVYPLEQGLMVIKPFLFLCWAWNWSGLEVKLVELTFSFPFY